MMAQLWMFLAAALMLTSCASYPKEGPWVERTVRSEKMFWRWCHVELDPPEKADQGWCWQGLECREIDHAWPRKNETQCRPRPLFCAFADVECMKKARFNEKRVR